MSICAARTTILVAEDDPGLLRALAYLLGREGYRTITATSGLEAVEVLRRNQEEVSLVLSDIWMPGLRRDRALERMRGLRPGLPIILHSGSETDLPKLQASELHNTRFLDIPWDARRLLQTILELLTAITSWELAPTG